MMGSERKESHGVVRKGRKRSRELKMSLMGLNVHRESWAHRASSGFSRAPAFDKQTQSTPNLHASNQRPQTPNDTRILEMNRTMSKLQFTRPSSAGVLRPSTANLDRPITAMSETVSSHNTSRPNTAGPSRSANSRLRESLEFGNSTANMDRFDMSSSNKQFSSTATLRMVETRVPHYIAAERIVLRFFCHFFEKDIQMSREPIRKFVGPSTARLFVLHIYLEDNSMEIFEERVPNSGTIHTPRTLSNTQSKYLLD